MNKRTYDLRERYPDPGTDPVARLRHVVDVFADEPADSMAVLATSGVHESGKTGLTWGDLKALLALVSQAPLAFTRNELILIQNGLATLEDDYGVEYATPVRERVDAEIERRQAEGDDR